MYVCVHVYIYVINLKGSTNVLLRTVHKVREMRTRVCFCVLYSHMNINPYAKIFLISSLTYTQGKLGELEKSSCANESATCVCMCVHLHMNSCIHIHIQAKLRELEKSSCANESEARRNKKDLENARTQLERMGTEEAAYKRRVLELEGTVAGVFVCMSVCTCVCVYTSHILSVWALMKVHTSAVCWNWKGQRQVCSCVCLCVCVYVCIHRTT
jgi:hypothetical protein